MSYVLVFYILSILMLLSSIFIFLEKKLVYSILALTTAFAVSSGVFLFMDQVLVALLQLLIFVGGLSTYLIVAVAYDEKGEFLSDRRRFFLAAILLAAGFVLLLLNLQSQSKPNGIALSSMAAQALSGYYILLYGLVLLLFVSTLGSVFAIKKFSKKLI